MSTVGTYEHPTHDGSVHWNKHEGWGYVHAHRDAHDHAVRKSHYPSEKHAKAALHRQVKAGNVPTREQTGNKVQAEAGRAADALSETVRALARRRRVEG